MAFSSPRFRANKAFAHSELRKFGIFESMGQDGMTLNAS
jgi:hypothetical protein